MKNLLLLPLLFLIGGVSFLKKNSSLIRSGNFMQEYVFDKEGHRGCRGLMPENTIPAMYKAIDLGVTTLEMDVVVSKDRQVVVSHEPWFESEITTKSDGSFIAPRDAMTYNLYLMNYDEIRQYDVGMKPHPRFPSQQKIHTVKPLLSDLFDSVEHYKKLHNKPAVKYNIEIKCLPAGDNKYHPEPNDFAELVMSVIKEKGLEQNVIIQSFDPRPLRYLHEKYPGITISLLVEDSNTRDFEGQIKNLGFIPEIYSPNMTLVDKDLVQQCHGKGMKIVIWTVNEKKDIRKFMKLKVDGIITDFPDLFDE